jgi:hypothetical protein
MESVGTTFSEGFLLLQPSEPITIDSVEVVGGDDALKYLGARIGLPGRPDDFNQFMKGFPPKAVPAKYQEPASGARLEDSEIYMLIIGYRETVPVMDLRTKVVVSYRTDDGTEYSEDFKAQVLTCPPALSEPQCTQQEGERFGEL